MSARLALAVLLAALTAAAQSEKPKVFYFPKPVARTAYRPPMKPVTRLADLQAKHKGESNWRELVIDDGNSKAYMVQEAPGTKHARRLYPDSPAWWAVLAGRIRFEIEKPEGGFDVFEARKGSYVFVPERLIHSLEVIGDEPAIRFEVTLYEATPVFEEKPSDTGGGSVEYIPVRLSTGLNPLDVPDLDGKPWPSHVNIYDLAKENEGKARWSREAMRKNRVRGNFICGQAGSEPALKPGDRGHFHADFAEFWVVMLGKLRWIFEGDEEHAVIAEQGDIVYAPPKTFHIPLFHGEEGLNCRLTSSTFPSANHLFDAEE
jgi:oxalate decarboxylase/phosphoglucose isomerase-like protein (cupin superfamily)